MSQSLINDFLPQLKQFINSETVFGEEYKIGDVTIIPVNTVKVAFVYGNGEAQPKNKSGAGGAVTLSPTAFIIIKDNQVTLQSLNSQGSLESILEKIPDFMDKSYTLFDKWSKRREEN